MTLKMIGIIGGGSWATAIVKIILENPEKEVAWWVRSNEAANSLANTGTNPRHLPSLHLDASRLHPTTDLNKLVSTCDDLVLAVPSAHLSNTLAALPCDALKSHRLISLVKGAVPENSMSVSNYLHTVWNVPAENICVVSGPSHAEEVAIELHTFLAVASTNITFATEVAELLHCHYVHTSTTDDIETVERCGLAKNIYAIAAGICRGLGYGDNLCAVLTTAAARELALMVGADRMLVPCFLGDLLVTCWSTHSRNRALGEAVARGNIPSEDCANEGIVAEGYYSAAAIHRVAKRNLPIANAVYRILYEKSDPRKEIDALIENVF